MSDRRRSPNPVVPVDPCSNPPPGSPLASACACQKAANALAISINQYNAEYSDYAAKQAAYSRALDNYNRSHTTWYSNRQGERTRLTNELKTMECGGCGTNQGCNVIGNGWISIGNPLACGYDLIGTPWGCNHICQRTEAQVKVDLGAWDQANPEPRPPARVPAFTRQIPNGNNIVCCSQQFSGINADSVTFQNVVQNCNQTIQREINAAAVAMASGSTTPAPAPTPTPTPTPAPTPTPTPVPPPVPTPGTGQVVPEPTGTSTNTILLIVGSIVALLILGFLVYMFFSRRKGAIKVPSVKVISK